MQKIFLFLRILLGAVFMASAVVKLFPIEAFEIQLLKEAGVTWALTPVVSRGLILLEFSLGAMLLFGSFISTGLRVALVLLVVFTAYLSWLLINGSTTENCGCFGELLPMTPLQSFWKNLVLMILTLVLITQVKKRPGWSWRPGGIVASVLFLAALLFFEPLPKASPSAATDMEAGVLNPGGLGADLSQGRHAVLVMHSGCVHCKQLANLVSTADTVRARGILHLLIYGDTEDVERFVSENGLQAFDYAGTSDRAILKAIDGTFPTLILLENGKVSGKWVGHDINMPLLMNLMNLP